MTMSNRRRASLFLLVFTSILAMVLAALLTQARFKVTEHAEHARLIAARSAIILDTAPVAMIMANTEGVITYFNPQAEHLLGWTSADMVGQPVSQLLTEDSAKRHGERFKKAIVHIKQHEGAWQFTRRVDGHAITQAGETIHVQVVVRGIKYNGYVEFAAVLHPVKCDENGKVHVQQFDPDAVGRTLPKAFEQAIPKQH